MIGSGGVPGGGSGNGGGPAGPSLTISFDDVAFASILPTANNADAINNGSVMTSPPSPCRASCSDPRDPSVPSPRCGTTARPLASAPNAR